MSEHVKPRRVESLSELQNPEAPMGDYFTNLEGSGRSLLARITELTGPSTLTKEELGKETFNARYYYCHPVPMVNDTTGEPCKQIRVVLESVEGETVSFVSAGVVASLEQICTHLTPADWAAGIPMRIESRRSSKGRNVLRLIVLDNV